MWQLVEDRLRADLQAHPGVRRLVPEVRARLSRRHDDPDRGRRIACSPPRVVSVSDGGSRLGGGEEDRGVETGLVGVGGAAPVDGALGELDDGLEARHELRAIVLRGPPRNACQIASMRASAAAWPSLSMIRSLSAAELERRTGRAAPPGSPPERTPSCSTRSPTTSRSARTSSRRSRGARTRTSGPGGPQRSRGDQDAGAGERADADVATVDLHRHRAVRRGRRDRARRVPVAGSWPRGTRAGPA